MPLSFIYLSTWASIINVDKLKLFEPSMLNEDPTEPLLPTITYSVVDQQEELLEGTILQRKVCETQRGSWELLQIGLKGKVPGKWLKVDLGLSLRFKVYSKNENYIKYDKFHLMK